MTIRKFVTFAEDVRAHAGKELSTPLRRVVLGAVMANPLAGKPVGTDLKPLIDLSVETGTILTQRGIELLGGVTQMRSYGKAALVGTNGDLEHGAVMIHARVGMAMRQTLKRGRVIIPGNAKVCAPGATADIIFGPMDEGWDLDAVDTMPIMIGDAPRADEIVLLVAYATGPRPHARSKGPDQKEVDALIATFGKT